MTTPSDDDGQPATQDERLKARAELEENPRSAALLLAAHPELREALKAEHDHAAAVYQAMVAQPQAATSYEPTNWQTDEQESQATEQTRVQATDADRWQFAWGVEEIDSQDERQDAALVQQEAEAKAEEEEARRIEQMMEEYGQSW